MEATSLTAMIMLLIIGAQIRQVLSHQRTRARSVPLLLTTSRLLSAGRGGI